MSPREREPKLWWDWRGETGETPVGSWAWMAVVHGVPSGRPFGPLKQMEQLKKIIWVTEEQSKGALNIFLFSF